MELAKEVTTEVLDEAFFGHVVSKGFSKGTAQFIGTVDTIAGVAACHSSNQDFLFQNGIFTPENNYRSQVYCSNRGLLNAIPTHNPVATATKSIVVNSQTVPREELFDMTPKPFWSHGIIGNTNNVVQTIGYGLGKVYSVPYNLAHGSLSFKESVGKVYDGSENIYKNTLGKSAAPTGEVHGPPSNPATGIGEVQGPPSNPTTAIGEVQGPPSNPATATGEVYGPPNPATATATGEVYGPPNLVTVIGYDQNISYDWLMNPTQFSLTENYSMLRIPSPNIEIPSNFVFNNGIGYRFGESSSIGLTSDGLTYSTQVGDTNVNVSADASLIKHIFTEYGPTIFGNAPKEVTQLGNGATLTESREMHGISMYKNYEIDDPANGINIKVSEYNNPDPIGDLENKYQAALQQKNIERALNFKYVETMIDGSTVTYTKEVINGKIYTKIVIDNPQKGIHIELSEKDDAKYQENAMAQYNAALQSDVYINKCRLAKLMQNTKDATPEQVDAERTAFLNQSGEYSNTKIHMWAHKQLLDYEMTVDNAVNISMGVSCMMAYNIFYGKYRKYSTKWEKTKEFAKDAGTTYGEIALMNTFMNHTLEEAKLFDLISTETFGKIASYASMGIFTAYQLCKIKFDKKRPHMRDNDINSFILNKALQTKVGILGKGFSSLITSYGLAEATSKWLMFGGCGINFGAMILFNWMVSRSISPYRDVVFATESSTNRLKDKIAKYNKTVKDEKSTRFEKDVLCKVLEIEGITKPQPIAKVVMDANHFVGSGFSYGFGGKF